MGVGWNNGVHTSTKVIHGQAFSTAAMANLLAFMAHWEFL